MTNPFECNHMKFTTKPSPKWDAYTKYNGEITFYFSRYNQGLDRRFTTHTIPLICELFEHEWIHRLIMKSNKSRINGRKQHFIMKKLMPWNRIRGID